MPTHRFARGVARCRTRLTRHSAAWLACLLCGVVGVAVLDDYDMFVDAPMQRETAEITLDYVWGRNDALLRYEDRTYGIAFEALLLGAERLLGLQDNRAIYLLRHLLTHLLFLAGGLGGYALAFRMYRSRALALGALSLFLLYPRLYAHSFFNSKDLPFLSLFMLALLLTHWAFRRGSVKAFLLCGAGIGVLSNVRPMGLLLLGAGLALRTLDFLWADRCARRRIAWSGGAFVAASAVTIYALLPYLWSDPLRRFAESLAFAGDQPHVIRQLFRGRYVWSTELPFAYVPVWFVITTPLTALGFGLLGSAATVRRGLRRRAALVRNTRLRFEWLLLACCVVPALVVAGLGVTTYSDWRHLYFIAAPFCLLATGGLRALADAARRFGPRAGRAYGLAGAGAGATLAAMVSLHPYQDLYFNAFVNRATPEALRTRYELNIVKSARDGLEFLLARYPHAPLYVALPNYGWSEFLLPAADQARVLSVAPGRADFFVLRYPAGMFTARMARTRGTLFPFLPYTPYAPVLYTQAAYGNQLVAVAALNLARVDAATAAPYRAALRTLKARAPVVRARFDIYRDAHAVSWVQEPCRPEDTELWFFLHVAPADPQDLPLNRRRQGFEVLNFSFPERGVRIDDACLVSVPLPAYPLRALQVGQRQHLGATRPLWQVDLPRAPAADAQQAYRAAYRALTARPPTRRAAFDVYVTASTVTLAKAPCAAADAAVPFRLRVEPADPQDLPGRPFDDLDFPFFARGVRFADTCLASVPRPAYPLRALQVGQQATGAARPLWQADLPLAPAALAEQHEYRAAYRTLTARPPARRAAFDAYVTASTVIFAKAPCAAADAEPKFILHVEPADPRGLAGRSFANLDFPFSAHGVRFVDTCLASVPLPAYPLRRLTAGQWIPGTAQTLWQADLALPRAPRAVQAYRRAWRALATAPPAYRGVFDVYVAANTVAYAKAPCTAADAEPRFILHVVPVRPRDLPPARQLAGFDNRDFRFAWQGAHFDGRCLARAPLPAYPIASLRVGQFRAGEEPLWLAEIPQPS